MDGSKLQQFKELTGATDEESKFYLDASSWDLQAAYNNYSGGGNEQPSLRPVQTTNVPQNVPQTKPQSTSTTRRTGGVRGLSDYKENEPDEEGTVSWFTGGEKSGLQVQAPPKKKVKDEVIDDIMKTAQESGAVSASDYKSPDSAPFSGGGYRLGATNQPTQAIPSKTKKEARVKIIMWKNGFSLDDGPLRAFDDPANQQFLESIKRGTIPQELHSLGSDIAVDLLDSREEDYKAPPKVLTPFAGSGHTLAGPTTTTTTTRAAANIPAVPNEDVKVDEAQPTTTIQIRLADGSRIVGKFNQSHSVKHIRQHINRAKPSNQAYSLCTAFPQKAIDNEEQTLAAAGLLNSVVVQKLL